MEFVRSRRTLLAIAAFLASGMAVGGFAHAGCGSAERQVHLMWAFQSELLHGVETVWITVAGSMDGVHVDEPCPQYRGNPKPVPSQLPPDGHLWKKPKFLRIEVDFVSILLSSEEPIAILDREAGSPSPDRVFRPPIL